MFVQSALRPSGIVFRPPTSCPDQDPRLRAVEPVAVYQGMGQVGQVQLVLRLGMVVQARDIRRLPTGGRV